MSSHTHTHTHRHTHTHTHTLIHTHTITHKQEKSSYQGWFIKAFSANSDRLGPYHVEYTPSRPIWEVKQRRAWLVLAWVTGWEYHVFKPLFLTFCPRRVVPYILLKKTRLFFSKRIIKILTFVAFFFCEILSSIWVEIEGKARQAERAMSSSPHPYGNLG